MGGIGTGDSAGSARTESRPADRPHEEESMTPTLDGIDEYAILLAALKAYDITGVRPEDLHRFRDTGEFPADIPPAVVRQARDIVEEERERLLRLTRSES
jgi:hypothetical protein